ncbi:MAG: hypothetical protein COT80_03390 [Candidatus Buchananbacteria bacterium CG10_big_fil_rev_8_21_14_0_10_33_19]|uniref:Epoxyqueuosine reductase QueH n=1 Tax=Candidatus Buchananbacteria bacterium CG10_big_fil_rev_8_21_14_0_10_33_19 TaxID=1974525 RepID=A0A2H0W361_9BACT|nr:MAG: hypothetical protein COT80_03390 [Candidatus Buchananbacteria bacterium CG10_big_fil_rev_8_21_14_0_10_33_19]
MVYNLVNIKFMTNSLKPKLLFHSCCAPCSGYLVSELVKNFEVAVYYNNPNIYPASEYQIRKNEAQKFFTDYGVKFIEIDYDHNKWLELVKGLEHEPERGRRCILCYHFRLESAAKYAKAHDYDFFASSLAISPYKKSQVLNNLGRAIAKKIGVDFIAEDWKKKDGYKKATAFAKDFDFYRQDYCGCEFSRRSTNI